MEKDKPYYFSLSSARETTKKPLWAIIVSTILHPIFMTSYSVALLFVYTDFKYIFANSFSAFMLRVAFFSCVVPLVSIYFYKRAGYIDRFSLNEKENRFLPLTTTFLSYSVLYFIFLKGNVHMWMLALLLVPILLLMISTIVSNWWNISLHMVGIGGLIGSVFSIAYNIKLQNPYELFIILIILAGLLGVSRIILHKNTPTQVYVGFIVGSIISYFTIFIVWYFPILYLLYIR